MKIAGIIAEYNPFHNGHAWHIRETRRLTGCDYVIACVDGHFSQRGEPSPFSKWNKARMALAGGVDAVFELPALFAVRTADAFARGGVAILGGLGVDCLSFGSETDDRGILETFAEISEKEPKSVIEETKKGLERGESHARARGSAIAAYLGLSPELVNQPNLILATEYIRTIKNLGMNMETVVVKRKGGYHDSDLGEFASASAIRAALMHDDTDVISRCTPEASRMFAVPEKLHEMDDLLLYRLRSVSASELKNLPDVTEGLEHRLFRLCRETGTRSSLLEAMKCKRYTYARLSRLLAHALLGFDKEMLAKHPLPTYARLIGLRRGAEPLLKELNRRAFLPMMTSTADLRDDPIFQLECRVTDIWALLHDTVSLRMPGRELTEKFVRL